MTPALIALLISDGLSLFQSLLAGGINPTPVAVPATPTTPATPVAPSNTTPTTPTTPTAPTVTYRHPLLHNLANGLLGIFAKAEPLLIPNIPLNTTGS